MGKVKKNNFKDMPCLNKSVTKLFPDKERLFLGACGFEPRSLGWVGKQKGQKEIFSSAFLIKYSNPKGRNLEKELRLALSNLCIKKPENISYDVNSPYDIENKLREKLEPCFNDMEEIVIDISAMTKLLILVCLSVLSSFPGTVRLVYSEPDDYPPTKDEYKKSKKDMKMFAKFPMQGVESIIRMKCLSSIRMQGQPVALVAFTSFNEQLVRHVLGTISPHRLIFINGKPPRRDYKWREKATQEIHNCLIKEYKSDNPIDNNRLLKRVTSTLHYEETINCIHEIYKNFGLYERIICAATGSKMQTVGLFFSKILHPEIHIEYPTPDSYYIKGLRNGVRNVYELEFLNFSETLKNLRKQVN